MIEMFVKIAIVLVKIAQEQLPQTVMHVQMDILKIQIHYNALHANLIV